MKSHQVLHNIVFFSSEFFNSFILLRQKEPKPEKHFSYYIGIA